MKHFVVHSTKNEIEFLKGLGTGAWDKDNRKKDRQLLLDKYIRAANFRAKWGDVDKLKAIEFAKSELR
jgi:hypothetical protein